MQSGCIWAKMWLYSDKVVVFGQKCLNSIKSGCFMAKWLYSGKCGRIRARWLNSDKVLVFGQKWLYSGKSGCIRAKVVVFGQKCL